MDTKFLNDTKFVQSGRINRFDFDSEGPLSQDQTGPKSQYMRTKLARRTSTIGPNWPEEQVARSYSTTFGHVGPLVISNILFKNEFICMQIAQFPVMFKL